MPRIAFFNRVYPPAAGATGELLRQLAEGLALKDWHVTVVTGPIEKSQDMNPPEGAASEVRVVRTAGIPFGRGRWQRACAYASLYPAFRSARIGSQDVVVTMTDPPLQLLLGPALRRRTGGALAHWAQDMYPEVAENLGVLRKGGFLANALRRMASRAMSRCSLVVAVGECMRQRITSRGGRLPRVEVRPNWALSSAQSAAEGRSAGSQLRRRHGWEGKFVVMYSGNLGLAHHFDSLLGAAALVARRAPGMLFVIAGDGARLKEVREKSENLANIRFLQPQPLEALPGLLAAADLHVVTMREDLEGLVVPSKVYGVGQAGRTCLFLGPKGSEAAEFLGRHGLGDVLANASAAQVADRLLEWMSGHAGWQRLCACADAMAGSFGPEMAIDRFDALFHSVLPGRKPGIERNVAVQ